MAETDLYKLMDKVLPKLGCGPFTLLLLYRRYGSITLEEARVLMKVSHITVVKFNKILKQAKLIERSEKKDFEMTDTALGKVPDKEDVVHQAHTVIVTIVLSHKRYSNNVYRKKNFNVMSKKVYDYIETFVKKKMKGSLKMVTAYCNWWIKNKVHLQFNYGLFTCDSIVNEFSRTVKSSPITKSKNTEKKKKIKSSMSKLEAEIGTNKVHRKTK